MRASFFAHICSLTQELIKYKMYLGEMKRRDIIYFFKKQYLKEVKK